MCRIPTVFLWTSESGVNLGLNRQRESPESSHELPVHRCRIAGPRKAGECSARDEWWQLSEKNNDLHLRYFIDQKRQSQAVLIMEAKRIPSSSLAG